MAISTLFCLAAWSAVSTVWSVLLFMQRKAIRNGICLQPVAEGSTPALHWPSVIVLVPARNEEKTIEACIAHILAQNYPKMRLIVIDDRSIDSTADLVVSLAQSDSRIELRRITSLPANWLAKSNALWQGTRDLDSADWLLFVDADVILRPQAIHTAVYEAEQRQLDLLTLWPRNYAKSFWEHLIIPLCGGIVALWFGNSGTAGAARPFANGQFLLVRQPLYERIGGHASVHTALIEDIPLAEQCAAAGASMGTFGGADLVEVRMYDGLRQVLDGWSRIFAGALRSGSRILLSVLWLLIGSLMPYLLAPLLIGSTIVSPTASNWMLLSCCISHLLLIHIVSHGFWKMGRCDRRYLWLYPLSVVFVLYILLRSACMLKITSVVRWRGVQYTINCSGCIIEDFESTMPYRARTMPIRS